MDCLTSRHQPTAPMPFDPPWTAPFSVQRATRTLPVLGLAALSACTVYIDVDLGSATAPNTSSGDTHNTGTADGTGTTSITTDGPTESTDGPPGSTGGTTHSTDGTTDSMGGVPLPCDEPEVLGDGLYPVSCNEVLVGTPGAPDGEYTLYAENDPARPWQAWCHHMDDRPQEYLILPMTGEDYNYSKYVPGPLQEGTIVRTMYSRVRINPYCFRVHVGDQTFSTSTGLLMHGRDAVTSMPYAVAMDCVDPYSMYGCANVDVRGTPFTVPPEQWSLGGFAAEGVVVSSADHQEIQIGGGGFCGYAFPSEAPDPGCPCNDWGDFYLRLEYTL